MSPTTAENMWWHKEGVRDKEGVMVHPVDGEAWKHFNSKYPEFAAETRNVCLGLSTDGFVLFNIGGHSYTCWPVFIVPYNLPPGMIMRTQNVLLPLIILGPTHHGRSIDIYLQPLIDELKSLWVDGVLTYDCFKKQNFKMKVTVMWTISDFPRYGMLSGWTTQGRLACPICMEDSKAFKLEGGKICWFDCHRRFLPEHHPFRFQEDRFRKNTIELDPPPSRLTSEEVFERISSLDQITFGSKNKKDKIPGYGEEHNWNKKNIFWMLPYWKNLLVRHNIDLMHLENNFFGIFFSHYMGH
jgi:Transposase family tnp2